MSDQKLSPIMFNKCIATYLSIDLPNITVSTIVIFRLSEGSGLNRQMLSGHLFFLDLGQEACRPIVGTLPVCVPSLVGLVTVLVVAGEVGLVAVAGLG